MKTIRFNKPYFTEKEIECIKEVIESGLVSGDRKYTSITGIGS